MIQMRASKNIRKVLVLHQQYVVVSVSPNATVVAEDVIPSFRDVRLVRSFASVILKLQAAVHLLQ